MRRRCGGGFSARACAQDAPLFDREVPSAQSHVPFFRSFSCGASYLPARRYFLPFLGQDTGEIRSFSSLYSR